MEERIGVRYHCSLLCRSTYYYLYTWGNAIDYLDGPVDSWGSGNTILCIYFFTCGDNGHTISYLACPVGWGGIMGSAITIASNCIVFLVSTSLVFTCGDNGNWTI